MKSEESNSLCTMILHSSFFTLSSPPLGGLEGGFLLLLFAHVSLSLYNIHYVVAQLFTLTNDVHVVDTHLITVFFVINVQNVLVLQLVVVR